MAELKNIRIAISGLYDYALEELPSLRLALPGQGAPDFVEKKNIYKVYRPANVLAAACDKFKLLPLTHHHPQTPVDGQNFRDLAIGYTGENPWVDYLKDKDEVGIRSSVMLYDDEAFDAYDRGERQLSPGYIANFEWVQNGKTPKGEPYDIIMTAITDVNHLALLPAGRGGEDAIVMDARKTYQVGEISETTGLQKKSDGSWGKPESAHGSNENAEIEKNLENSKIVEKPYKDGDNFFKLDSDLLDINGHISKENGAIIDQIYFSDKYAEDPTEESTIDPKVKGKGYATKGVIKAIDHFKERGFDTFKVDTMSPYSAKLMKRLEEKGVVKPLSNWRFDGDTVEYKILKTSNEVHDGDVHVSIFDLVRKREGSNPSVGSVTNYTVETSLPPSGANIQCSYNTVKLNGCYEQDGAPFGNDNASKDHKKEEEIEGLGEAEKEHLKDVLEKNVVPFKEVEFSKENYDKYLGQPINTPLGKVKMGANQFEKLSKNHRQNLILAVHDTLEKPCFIAEEKGGTTLYVKSFNTGKRNKNIMSVVIKRDGLNISISAHEERTGQILDKIKKAGVLSETSGDDGTVHDERVADTTRVVSLNIVEDDESVKLNNCYMTIFDRVKGTVFDLYK